MFFKNRHNWIVIFIIFTLIVFVILLPSFLSALFYGGMIGTDMFLTKQYPMILKSQEIACGDNNKIKIQYEERKQSYQPAFSANFFYLIKNQSKPVEIPLEKFKIPKDKKLYDLFLQDFVVQKINSDLEKIADTNEIFFLINQEQNKDSFGWHNNFSLEDFNIFSICLSKNNRILSQFKEGRILPQVLIYNLLTDTSVYERMGYEYQSILTCPDKDFVIFNDYLEVYFVSKEGYRNFSLGKFDSYHLFQRTEANIVKFNLERKLGMEKAIIKYISIDSGNIYQFYTSEEYANKFFNTNGIKNEYLAKCISQKGENVFGLFKK